MNRGVVACNQYVQKGDCDAQQGNELKSVLKEAQDAGVDDFMLHMHNKHKQWEQPWRCGRVWDL